MTSHKLAKLLLEHKDLPIATHANNHTSTDSRDVKVGVLRSWDVGESIIIGNYRYLDDKEGNEYVSETIYDRNEVK